jgi:DNA-binding CsgD family transcriptional regulator
VVAETGAELVGRDAELSLIESWLVGAERGELAGREPVLTVEGDPGIGKTTVWAEAISRAGSRGWTVLACRPRPSDVGRSHLGLTDLLRPVTDEAIRELPPPQRRALLVATFRDEPGPEALDPLAVGIGLAGLLGAEAAARGPLLFAVDDLQWLDRASASALAFALSRVSGQPVRCLATVRLQGARRGSPALAAIDSSLGREGLRRIQIGPLSVAALHHILVGTLGRPVTRRLLVRIHSATEGNPFLALEIARELHRVGQPQPGRPLPVPPDQRDIALLRVRRLPQVTRDVLAEVAVMSRPSAAVLDAVALAPAEKAGVVQVLPDGLIDFTHPLFGSALYASLPEATRRKIHLDVSARSADPEERARHLALAATGPDAEIAAELDRAAEAAGTRGAAGTVVELMQLAVLLTPPDDVATLMRRQIELADRQYFAGDPTAARAQLERCLDSSPRGEPRAQALLALGSVLWSQGDVDRGLSLMTDALEDTESPSMLARIHSRLASMAEDTDLGVEHAEAALALIDAREDPLLYSFALHNAARYKLFAGLGADHDAVDLGMQLQREGASWEVSVLPAYWALYFDDFDTARTRFEDLVRVFRDRGDEARCSVLLAHLAVLEAFTGHSDQARALAGEALDLATQTEQETWIRVALWARGQVAARGGDLTTARAAAFELLERLESQPDITLENMARAVLGLAAISAGDHAEADRQLTRCDEIVAFYHAREPAADRFHGDHAEAVISLGDFERAERLVARLEQRAAALPRPWIQVVAARSRGLLCAARGDLEAAGADFERALEAQQSLAMPTEMGRTLLAMGRLYRRRHEWRRARGCLEEAVRSFERAGAASWTAVAREELRRAGGRLGDRDELTATEQKIAELAASGLRNREIASRLFLSEKTVEANLSRVYGKLDIRSRAELGRRLPPRNETAAPVAKNASKRVIS